MSSLEYSGCDTELADLGSENTDYRQRLGGPGPYLDEDFLPVPSREDATHQVNKHPISQRWGALLHIVVARSLCLSQFIYALTSILLSRFFLNLRYWLDDSHPTTGKMLDDMSSLRFQEATNLESELGSPLMRADGDCDGTNDANTRVACVQDDGWLDDGQRPEGVCNIWETFDHIRAARKLSIKTPLSTLFLRDGTLYFIVLIVLNIGQVVVAPSLCVSQLIYTLSSILMSRFFLNLRQTGEHPATERTADGPSTIRFLELDSFEGELGHPQ
ncbi:uncharacterized protein PHACADRAFT_213651 [Phanerochaete carnosa HHB-10118-sp]|uniref:Uncharacterized protein n=1 Tax=Phanerochaete carnosa (strain HHB-10118-sp) TaxID=650164 RepID=K5WKI4_PHACS|nr:uncharacterized protein PHACADRAFT_213651 [Phanerochaete carnosa HHB-10118-sp]EKM50772.1 hypothetical protein PHACADRAFT_213651 [Phanerochaete carnosa HHB-10118-sp]